MATTTNTDLNVSFGNIMIQLNLIWNFNLDPQLMSLLGAMEFTKLTLQYGFKFDVRCRLLILVSMVTVYRFIASN